MLDTNIIIYILKNKPPAVRKRFNEHLGNLYLSSVVMMELLYGARKSQQKKHNMEAIEDFTSRLDLVNFDGLASDHASDIKFVLESKGRVIGPYDLMIAGHARSRGSTLITNNTKEFDRVDGLLLDNWV